MEPEASYSSKELDILAEPLAKNYGALLKKVSNAIGILYEPFHINRMAKARGRSALTEAEYKVAADDLYRRADYRRREEDARHQKNIEDILEQASSHMNADADADLIDNDWAANYVEKCRIVSDTQMQNLWAQVLAGETNAPGSYSKRTVNFLSEMEKREAGLFTSLCGFGWHLDEGVFVPVVFDYQGGVYNSHGIDFETLKHLESIGLIQLDAGDGFVRQDIPEKQKVYYYGRELILTIPTSADGDLHIGIVYLTNIGRELSPICGSKPVGGFWDYVKSKWEKYLPEEGENAREGHDPLP